MKVIPYLRFAWAAYIVMNFVRNVGSQSPAEDIELLLIALGGLYYATFVCYCILIGLQEIRNTIIVKAKFFELFGLFAELLMFLGGLYLLMSLIFTLTMEPWRIGLTVIYTLGLLGFIVVDIKRLRTA